MSDSNKGGWIGVDLDGTVAHYEGWVHHTSIGQPIPAMVNRIKTWRSMGCEVRIFTARVYPLNTCVESSDTKFPVSVMKDEAYLKAIEALEAIQDWCREHIGEVLPVTNVKDYAMTILWDDRAVGVERNTGKRIGV